MAFLQQHESLQVGAILVGMLGGLAIFLFGMEMMTASLKVVAGGRMRDFLGRWTTNRFRGLFAGAFVTAIIQSSSVTTVMVVGFVAAGMMTLQQSIGVILGANIGTTITAHIIAFDVTALALAMVAFGYSLLFFSKNDRIRQVGNAIMGLGLLFFGMELMGLATEPLTTYDPLIQAMQNLDSVIPALIISAVFTAVVQSSSATTGLVIVFANEGLIPLETGIAMVLGANIGTSITAVLASAGQPAPARQTAAIHVIFNTLGAIIWIPLIAPLADLLQQSGATDVGRQVAWASTIFNVGNAFIFIWFARPLAWLVRKLVRERPEAVSDVVKPKYLDELLLDTPALAIDRVRLELGELGRYTLAMVEESTPSAETGTSEELQSLAAMDDTVDSLHAAIVAYLGKLGQESLPDPGLQRHSSDYLAAANYIESIADVIETNLVDIGLARLDKGVQVSEETSQLLAELHTLVCMQIKNSIQSLVEGNRSLAKEVIGSKKKVNNLAQEAEKHIGLRLTADEPNRVATFQLESEVIEYLKRMYYFAKRIAKLVSGMDEHSLVGSSLSPRAAG
jgi:phosphate:Na+ symporter